MNKQELIQQLAESTEYPKAQCERVLDALTETIHHQLAGGGEVKLHGVGKFCSRQRAARTARNPQTGESVQVKARKVPAFVAAKGLKDAVA